MIAAQKDLPVDDMAMIVCRDKGCFLNYCGLVKKSVESEWKNSGDCSQEIVEFNDCMT